MTPSRMDADWEHLYPDFRVKLRQVLEEIERLTGEPWKLVEGYRSQERQTWLYRTGALPGDEGHHYPPAAAPIAPPPDVVTPLRAPRRRKENGETAVVVGSLAGVVPPAEEKAPA